jgi:DNA polymerase V
VPPPKKGIGTSRSFGRDVRSLDEMQEAVAAYTAKAAEKLRRGKLLTGYIQVHVENDAFKPIPFYSRSAGLHIDPPTAYTPELVRWALKLLDQVYREGLIYKRAGVMLLDLSPAGQEQPDLYAPVYQHSLKEKLMAVIDQLNRSTNSGKLFWASEGTGKPWYMRQAHKSKRFTTRWDELLTIRI